jgi:CTP synthase
MPQKAKSIKKTTDTKYIFVVGGVISGVGKGITTSSIGKILQARGHSVTAIKVDPYVNIDAGTMNPTEHGEVFVLADGDECDQDMGNYERFLGTTLYRDNYMTTGRVYQSVINRERNLEYKGKCVQVVPHVPLEVISRIKRAGQKAEADIVLVEIGGTVGEYENILFLEAIRMLKMQEPKNVLTVMVSYVPIPSKVGEMKTKPTQHAVRTLQGTGIQPDIIIARSSQSLDAKRKEKIALFCNIREDRVISAPDIDSVYDVPLNFEKDNVGDIVTEVLGLPKKKGEGLIPWKNFFAASKNAKKTVHIAIVGKYFDTGEYVLSDSYISVIEALKYSAYSLKSKIEITWINSKDFESKKLSLKVLDQYDGILVPGGFGSSGIEGKILAIQYARTHKIPFFGICYGMQLAVVEYARHVLGWSDANTTEANPKTLYPVIDILAEQKAKIENKEYGNSMRLGNYAAVLSNKTIAVSAYNATEIVERHRHRYEVYPSILEDLRSGGLVLSGMSPDGTLTEIIELPKTVHPFYLACQFHPEFLARPLTPHPLFTAFVKVALANKKVDTKL